MPRQKMLPNQLRGCRAALTFFAVSSSLVVAYETRPLVGLDLVEDRTAEMMESMKADMVRTVLLIHFLLAVYYYTAVHS